MGWIKRTESIDAITGVVERASKWWPQMLAAIISGGGWGWATHALAWMEAWSPLSWVIAATIGALLGVLIVWIGSAAALWLAKTHYYRKQESLTETINPLNGTFSRQRIKLSAFENPFGDEVVGKSFADCELIGPAIISFSGMTMFPGKNNFTDCDVVVLKNNAQIKNSINFRDVTIRDCRVLQVTILIEPDFAISLINSGVWPKDGRMWITTTP